MSAGGWPNGELHHRATLTWEDVDLMRDLADEGLSMREIADKFEVPYFTCVDVIKFKTWRATGRTKPRPEVYRDLWKFSAKLDWDKVRDIRARYGAGEVSMHALAREYGVSHRCISNVVHERTWQVRQ